MPSQHYVAGLLERGMRTLLYSGTYDWQCSWYATKLWLDKLEWTGAAAYRAKAFREWRVAGDGGGERAGEVKTVGPLTFATVRGAGHMMSVFFFSLSCYFPSLSDLAFGFAVYTSRTTSPWRRRRWSRAGSRSASYKPTGARKEQASRQACVRACMARGHPLGLAGELGKGECVIPDTSGMGYRNDSRAASAGSRREESRVVYYLRTFHDAQRERACIVPRGSF